MTERVVTQEEVVSHLAQVGKIETWEGFLEALSEAKTENAALGILHSGSGSILLEDYHSSTHDSGQVTRLGLDFYLHLAEPADMVFIWRRLNPWQGESFNKSVANKAWEEVLGAFLHKAFYEKIMEILSDDNLVRIITLLADPHHFTERDPYCRIAKEFLLKLWQQYVNLRTMSGVENDISKRQEFVKGIEKEGILARALVNWGLSDVLIKTALANTRNSFIGHQDLYPWVSYCFINHPYCKRRQWAWTEGESHMSEILELEGNVYEPIKEAAKALVFFRGIRNGTLV